MEDVMMDTGMEQAAPLTMDRKLTVQQTSNAMAGPVAAAAGVTRIATPVSMSILDLIMLDHNCVRAMYDAYRSPAVNMEQRQLLAWNMIMALSAHAAKEELVVYPVVRSTLGAAMADKLTGDHQLAKNLLATLDTLGADDPNFDMQLRASLDSQIAHMQDEEQTVLPQLSAVLDVETQLRLGILFESAKVRAPTRPHPEIATAALPPPFFENQLAATKLVDASLDQARMPALAPTAVGLSPLASAAVISSTMDSALGSPGDLGGNAAGAGGFGGNTAGMGGASMLAPQSMGMPAMPVREGATGEGLGGDSMAEFGGGVMGAQFMGMGGTSPTGRIPSSAGAAGGAAGVPVTPTPDLAARQLQETAGEGLDEGVTGDGDRVNAAAGLGFNADAVEGLLAADAGPLGAGVDAEAVPYPEGITSEGMGEGLGEGVGNLVPASEAGAAAVPDYTDVGVGGNAGVPTDAGDTEMGAAGGMPGDLTAAVNAPVEPPVAAGGGVGGFAGSRGGEGVNVGVKPTGGDFADDIGGTDVEAVKDVGQQDLAPAGQVEEAP